MNKNKRKNKNLVDYKWTIKIVITAFLLSILFSYISETAIPNLNILFGILLTLIIVFIGIIFDMIGVAVTVSSEAKFHSMSAQKIKGAKMAVNLKKNSAKVSSFCNDVIGDICGIISGSTGTVISIKIIESFSLNNLVITLIIMSIISAITIGGKALVKGIAMKKCDSILITFARFLSIFESIK